MPSHEGTFVPPGEYDRTCAWIDRFNYLCAAHGRVSSGMQRHVLPLIIAPSHRGSVHLPNTLFLGPTAVNNPNGILIGSAVFAQLMAKYLYFMVGAPFSQIALPMRDLDPHLIHDSLGPSKAATQRAS